MGAQQSQAANNTADTPSQSLFNQSTESAAADSSSALPLISLSTLNSHNSPSTGIWIAVHGIVYDVTNFMSSHPGGSVVLENVGGSDATVKFLSVQHSADALLEAESHIVGRLESPAATKSIREKSTIPRLAIIYSSTIGTTEKFARRLDTRLRQEFSSAQLTVELLNMNKFEPENLTQFEYAIVMISTYTDGTPPESGQFFFSWLSEAVSDFRVGPEYLSRIKFAVFGCGNSLYEENYNIVAKQIFSNLRQLGAQRLCALGLSDESVDRRDLKDGEFDYREWIDHALINSLKQAIYKPAVFQQRIEEERLALELERAKERRAQKKNQVEEKEEKEAVEEYSDDEEAGDDGGEPLVDMEELGAQLKSSAAGGQAAEKPVENKRREMLTDSLRENLTKQGYKLIGSHSGVKLCRWTKAMLRGRGGCYKYTFYGIQSFQCMESTPSLACANKCTFCWRHHTNPVGKEWRWAVDSPEYIVEHAMEYHKKMIAELKGVPGVQPERFKAAQTIRHCALSLVGEPIMYPHINKLVELLHENGISSFLVTNAQFPDRIQQMSPVTQLYVSVDASTRESLKAVDRPLFSDFWQRFLDSLKSIKDKQQRTVYRLTLVKAFNMAEVAEYSKLVSLGMPTFIEIKGVTFCGKSNASSITMSNVPFHEEVRAFGEELVAHLNGEYELACEHQHSCCILIAHKRMKNALTGKWNTWINYPEFLRLAQRFKETGESFTDVDYSIETPSWAVWGAAEQGFDPKESRFNQKVRQANTPIEDRPKMKQFVEINGKGKIVTSDSIQNYKIDE